jgi:hypothetical protein
VTLLLSVAACSEDVPLPEELIGTYTTNEPRYAERYLDLAPDQIEFGLGEAGVSRHRIKSISLEQQDGKTLYVLAYAGQEGGTDYLRFFHDETRRDEIVLSNQTTITWSKRGARE